MQPFSSSQSVVSGLILGFGVRLVAGFDGTEGFLVVWTDGMGVERTIVAGFDVLGEFNVVGDGNGDAVEAEVGEGAGVVADVDFSVVVACVGFGIGIIVIGIEVVSGVVEVIGEVSVC